MKIQVVSVVLSLCSLVVHVTAQSCASGSYSATGSAPCTYCPAGQYSIRLPTRQVKASSTLFCLALVDTKARQQVQVKH